MPIKLINAIVIRSIDYKESDRLLTLFSPEEGRVTAAMRGVKKSNAKLKFASQLYNYGEYEISSRGGSVTGCRQIKSFFGIGESIEAFYAGGAAAELLCRSELTELSDKSGIFGELLKLLTVLEMKGNAWLALALFMYYLGESEGSFPRRTESGEAERGGLFYVRERLRGKSYGDEIGKEDGKRLLSVLYGFYMRELGRLGSLDVLLTF